MAENQQSSVSGSQQSRGKKRSKSYYIRAKEGKRVRKDTMLSIGMRGILLTCNHGVKPCIKEAYNLLSEYADQMYGPEKDPEEDEGELSGSDDDGGDDDDCDDMEASLQKEIAGMKKQRKERQQRFQAVESGAKNVAFIKAKIDDPCELVHRILTDIQETKTSKSRHIMRMLPVTATYRSYLEDIEKQAGHVLKPHFELDDKQELSFCIMFKVRNCGHLKRNDVISALHRIVTEMGNHRVDLTNPDKVILVEGVRNVCCISVLKDFFKLRKYNLNAIMEGFREGNKEQRYRRKPSKKDTSSGTDNSADKVGKNEEKSSEGNLNEGGNGDRESNSGKEPSQVTTCNSDVTDATAGEDSDKTVDKTEEMSSLGRICQSGETGDAKILGSKVNTEAEDEDRKESKNSTGDTEVKGPVVASIPKSDNNETNETTVGKIDEQKLDKAEGITE